MGNRKQPFGYRMTLGEITIRPEEAETVRSIYLQYIAGASFKQLAEQLQAEDVLYDEDMMLQRKPRARYRVNHISWWAQELPSDEEYAEARRNLDAVGWQVAYIITHCAPTSIAPMGRRHNEADQLTDFLQEVRERAKYHYWLFGHYHDNKAVDEKHILLWEQIVRVI